MAFDPLSYNLPSQGGVQTTSTTSTTIRADPHKLNSDERKRVNYILTTPKECPDDHTKEEMGSPNSTQKAAPIIDVFLNPARSKELEDMLKQSEKGGASATRTKVTNDTFFILNSRMNLLERFPTCSDCFGSRPCPATPPTPHQSQLTC